MESLWAEPTSQSLIGRTHGPILLWGHGIKSSLSSYDCFGVDCFATRTALKQLPISTKPVPIKKRIDCGPPSWPLMWDRPSHTAVHAVSAPWMAMVNNGQQFLHQKGNKTNFVFLRRKPGKDGLKETPRWNSLCEAISC